MSGPAPQIGPQIGLLIIEGLGHLVGGRGTMADNSGCLRIIGELQNRHRNDTIASKALPPAMAA